MNADANPLFRISEALFPLCLATTAQPAMPPRSFR